MDLDSLPEFITTKQLGRIINIPEETLTHHRKKGISIPFVKFGKAVRYRKSDVLAYVQANTFQQTPSVDTKNTPVAAGVSTK